MSAAILSQRYYKTGNKKLLVPIPMLFTFSLWTNEGVCALFVVLLPALLVFNAWNTVREEGAASLSRPRLTQLLVIWGLCVLAYAIPAVVWLP